ncbi:hypothetical protein K493DRAFT_270494 [Basidiobolus meristosporus CBS 931.73]|uniref:Velvet domain-containing protein n=1 Tax=Basidiobolus meristosporus CBS 931.73 TaxID=1314790 RepID=A0A1Y1X7V9_9FUNG|nr:hypothetical protein K493DRAFT_270494 [Basidiobolus meristosporus CBS 931.73]|eukprot:ORX81414.1 hypothetical protein K493DRAFT_270494 [Basidiobolus meristosporus CBS 931.73]
MPQDHQFVDLDRFTSLQDNSGIELIMRQNPDRAQVCTSKDKLGEKPVDPPPIVQIRQSGTSTQDFNHILQNPSFFMMTEVIGPTDVQQVIPSNAFSGTLSSSLHKLKDVDNNDGGFFIFPEISVKLEGSFRLRFKLYQIHEGSTHFITSLCSDVFTVYSSKTFPGIQESTFLSRSFSDQGARIRVRKGSRSNSKRKGSTLAISSYPSSSNLERRNSQFSIMEGLSPNKVARSPSLELVSDSENCISMERRASYLIASHLSSHSDKRPSLINLSPRPLQAVFHNPSTSYIKSERESTKTSPESTSFSECSTNSISSTYLSNTRPIHPSAPQIQVTPTSLPPIVLNSEENSPVYKRSRKYEPPSPLTTTTDFFPNMFDTYLSQLNIPLSSDNGRTRCQRR